MTVDKNQAVIEYLLSCPIVQDNQLFFNFAEEADDNNQIITHGDDTALNKPYIDGSVSKSFTFTMLIYKAVTYNPVVKTEGYVDESVSDISDIQAVIDWVIEQNENKVFPNFGESCIIESVEPTTNRPTLNGVNVSAQPPLAQYQVLIKITYLDISKMLWKKTKGEQHG